MKFKFISIFFSISLTKDGVGQGDDKRVVDVAPSVHAQNELSKCKPIGILPHNSALWHKYLCRTTNRSFISSTVSQQWLKSKHILIATSNMQTRWWRTNKLFTLWWMSSQRRVRHLAPQGVSCHDTFQLANTKILGLQGRKSTCLQRRHGIYWPEPVWGPYTRPINDKRFKKTLDHVYIETHATTIMSLHIMTIMAPRPLGKCHVPIYYISGWPAITAIMAILQGHDHHPEGGKPCQQNCHTWVFHAIWRHDAGSHMETQALSYLTKRAS